MVRTIAGSLSVQGGNLVVADDLQAVIWRAAQRLRFFFGEWYRSPNDGVPYFQEVIVALDSDLAAQLIANELRDIEEITGVDIRNVEHDRTTRDFRAEAHITTIYGDAVVPIGTTV